MSNAYQPTGYRNLITISIFVLIFGGCFYYFESQPECIKIISTGQLYCSCYFNSHDDWKKFKNKSKTLDGMDDWQAVMTEGDPCKDAAEFKKAFSNTENNTNNSQTVPETTNDVTTNPTQNLTAEYYYRLGNTVAYKKDYQDAIADYNRAIELDPKNGEYYSVRGIAEQQLGFKQDACGDWQKAGELGNQYAISVMNNFCNIKFVKPKDTSVLINEATNSTENTDNQIMNIDIPVIIVAGGSFIMGTETSGQNASPVHKVRLRSFYIAKNLTSVSLWDMVMKNEQSDNNSPITNVSWDDVQNFISKLNAITKKHYRLPTEAEWEYAARGGNESKRYNYSGTNNSEEIHQRGKSNELGIIDMTGIDWQWCVDWCNAGFYKDCPELDPEDFSPSNMRIKRGGGWANRPENCTVTFRHALEPDRSDADISFRLVLDQE